MLSKAMCCIYLLTHPDRVSSIYAVSTFEMEDWNDENDRAEVE